ncbi:BQ2448_6133 [Microbotryum intermedium]|uniref:BQ2448_6133 protein n=1 Tax=Microbotryum intermedium TaxID=269621 RepID=A0A238FNX4_9BASI|nr:BQ2448_6133 [Microbotryum intermedium]
MNWLADQVEGLAKQASEITMYDIKSVVNQAKNIVMNFTEMEAKVRDATNDDAWGASSTLMQEIAQGTFNFQLFNEIMPTIYARFTEKEARQWRQIYKALVLLEYLVKNGSERVIDDARAHLSLIKVLRNFHYTDENGKDQGINVRNRSKELAELLGDLDRVRQERRKAKANRNKYTGVSSDGFGGRGGGGPSFTSATGSRYGGFGSDSMGTGSGEGREGVDHGGFSDSRAPAGDFEEYDPGDWEDKPSRSNSGATRTSGSGSDSRSRALASVKPTPPAPKPEPPKAEVNLFDFDEEDDQPTPPPKATSIAAPAAAASLDDDFDDFQSAAPTPSVPSLPISPASAAPKQNVFAMLNAQPSTQIRPPQSNAAPSMMGSFAPMQAQSAIRPNPPSQTNSTTSVFSQNSATSSSAAAAQAKPKAAASDFSDLFGSFGGAITPAPKSGSANGGMTIAQIAEKKRQESLFNMSNGELVCTQEMTGGGLDTDICCVCA